eukprot:GFKZ01002030.1.p1 GENE.GFKZ01002030.1~~GFKZ01002030.1.p1  ORF type:complete len:478 (+),score=81.22 GFKZ01002030.1:152-1585(+)
MSNRDSDDAAKDVNPQKELLAEAAAAIRADRDAREARRPKNVGQGAVGLVGDSLGGAALGAAAIVMGPVEGYKQAGPKGVLGGAIGGLAVGVATTTYGIGSGIAKLVTGTGRTIKSFQGDQIADRLKVPDGAVTGNTYAEDRARVYGSLLDDMEKNASTAGGSLQPPVEMELYHVLGVEADASPAQIRKAYYKMAQRFHPDKHPDDPEATQKFQKVSAAYQILSDPVKREEYHRVGANAANEGEMVDPKALFALMFSDFEHIVGDLATATIWQSQLATEGNPEDAEATAARQRKRKEFQENREANLVKLLEKRCESWLRGDEASFVEHAKLEVRALRAQPFGREVLRTAAYIYKKKASRVLDHGKGPFTGVTNFIDDMSEKAHNVKSHMRALEGGLKALSEAQNTAENESIDEAARREVVSTLGAVWLASVVDIEKTLMKVVSEFLSPAEGKESSRDPVVQSKAEALLVLAQVFKQA